MMKSDNSYESREFANLESSRSVLFICLKYTKSWGINSHQRRQPWFSYIHIDGDMPNLPN